MRNVVFILGAGASKQCGAPLMNDFLETAFHLWKTNKVQEKQEHFERVFRAISALQIVHSKSQIDLDNIESIFTALEMANVLGKLPRVRDRLKLARLSLEGLSASGGLACLRQESLSTKL